VGAPDPGTALVRAVPADAAAGAGALAAGDTPVAFGAEGGALFAPVLAAPAGLAGFAGVGAGFCAGAGAGAGSADDVCVADVLTPGSRSAGGGAIAVRPGVGAALGGVLEALL
jgi:hypothetical protein